MPIHNKFKVFSYHFTCFSFVDNHHFTGTNFITFTELSGIVT